MCPTLSSFIVLSKLCALFLYYPSPCSPQICCVLYFVTDYSSGFVLLHSFFLFSPCSVSLFLESCSTWKKSHDLNGKGLISRQCHQENSLTLHLDFLYHACVVIPVRHPLATSEIVTYQSATCCCSPGNELPIQTIYDPKVCCTQMSCFPTLNYFLFPLCSSGTHCWY